MENKKKITEATIGVWCSIFTMGISAFFLIEGIINNAQMNSFWLCLLCTGIATLCANLEEQKKKQKDDKSEK